MGFLNYCCEPIDYKVHPLHIYDIFRTFACSSIAQKHFFIQQSEKSTPNSLSKLKEQEKKDVNTDSNLFSVCIFLGFLNYCCEPIDNSVDPLHIYNVLLFAYSSVVRNISLSNSWKRAHLFSKLKGQGKKIHQHLF